MLRPLTASESLLLREFLTTSAYTDGGLAKRPALSELPSRHRANWPMLLDDTEEKTALNLLLRLFLLGLPANREDVLAVASGPILALCQDSGLLRLDNDCLAATVMLTPLDQFWIASDPIGLLYSGVDDVVIWPNQ